MVRLGCVLFVGGLVGLSGAQEAATPSVSAQAIVEREGALVPLEAGKCGQTRVQAAEQKILTQIQLKQFVDAHGTAQLAARTVAVCELHPEVWNQPGGKKGAAPSPETMQQHIGRALAYQYLAASAGSMVTPEDQEAKQSALTLFKGAGDGEGGALAKQLTAAEDKQTTQAAQISSATLTGRAAAGAFEDNAAAFNSKYDGKRITIDTTIRTIGSTSVTLNGIVNKNPDKARLLDSINCEVKDESSIAALHKAEHVRATGIYDKQMTSQLGPITITQCTLEPAGR